MGTNKYSEAKSFEEMAEQQENTPVVEPAPVKAEEKPQVETNETTE